MDRLALVGGGDLEDGALQVLGVALAGRPRLDLGQQAVGGLGDPLQEGVVDLMADDGVAQAAQRLGRRQPGGGDGEGVGFGGRGIQNR